MTSQLIRFIMLVVNEKTTIGEYDSKKFLCESKFVGSNHLYRYISYFFTEVQDHSLHEY